jgi:cysteine desulfurase/selenocysteine lyase
MSTSQQLSLAKDITRIRDEFPILHQEVNGKPLIYFDNAASNQKPVSVIGALEDYYKKDHSNIHRGIHTLAERATKAFEQTRKRCAEFIHAAPPKESIWLLPPLAGSF